uniref:Endonuclease/exonuclease/phosphatase domain-containing protein n=1 Tax=Opuntia streptacantha TaxID=393608 RepID=A0A7C8YQP7_OPUST
MAANINIISWNVRGLNCPNKSGDVKWVLRNFRCDIAILQETKMEEVNFSTAFSLWGRRSVDWLVLPSVGRSGGIVFIWDDQVLELVDSKVGTYAICGKFKSLNDDFLWGLIGVYGPNDDNLRLSYRCMMSKMWWCTTCRLEW